MVLSREILKFDKICQEVNELINFGLFNRHANRKIYEAFLAYSIIKLHNAWAVTCRSIIVRSAVGDIQTRSGIKLIRSAVLRRGVSPIQYLKNHWSDKRNMQNAWEPNWHIPDQSSRAANLLALVNESIITDGLGAGTAPLELSITRNAVAHGLPTTWYKFRKLEKDIFSTRNKTPAEFIISRDKKGIRCIDKWFKNLHSNLWAAIQ